MYICVVAMEFRGAQQQMAVIDAGEPFKTASFVKMYNASAFADKAIPNENNHKSVEEIPIADNRNLHKGLRNILIFGQIAGHCPVMGITEQSADYLYFNWKTWKMAYCSLSCFCSLALFLILLVRMLKSGADLFTISELVFQMCRIAIFLGFLHAAKQWPTLMKEWRTVEVQMKSYGWPKNLEFKINCIACVVLGIAAVQMAIEIGSNLQMASSCNGQLSFAEYYYTVLAFPYIFNILQYSVWTGIFLQVINFLNSITWCFMDLFIMVMSTALAMRFEQVTSKLYRMAKLKTTGEIHWKLIREDYNRLCKLCKTLDDTISYIVLMSFGTNLFSILIQLFNSLRKMKSGLDKFYFFFAFGFLILRTIQVSLYAAWINDESKKPVPILNSVPSSVYNIEIRRFIQQISYDCVALTGRNFFSVTRGLILSVAGAIVTYELVLIQFNENLLSDEYINITNGCIHYVK